MTFVSGLAWRGEPLPLTLFRQESFRKVYALFQLTESLLQFIEFAEPRLQVMRDLGLIIREVAATTVGGHEHYEYRRKP